MLDPEKKALSHTELKNSLVTIIQAYASRVLDVVCAENMLIPF